MEQPTDTVPAPRDRPETDAPALAAPELEGTGTGTVAVGEERASALAALAARADAHAAAAARAPRTRTAYAGDWEHFTRWCALAARAALPADVGTVRLYLTDLEAARTETRPDTGAGIYRPVYQPATLARRLAAIAAAHRDAGHRSPTPPWARS